MDGLRTLVRCDQRVEVIAEHMGLGPQVQHDANNGEEQKQNDSIHEESVVLIVV